MDFCVFLSSLCVCVDNVMSFEFFDSTSKIAVGKKILLKESEKSA